MMQQVPVSHEYPSVDHGQACTVCCSGEQKTPERVRERARGIDTAEIEGRYVGTESWPQLSDIVSSYDAGRGGRSHLQNIIRCKPIAQRDYVIRAVNTMEQKREPQVRDERGTVIACGTINSNSDSDTGFPDFCDRRDSVAQS
jgi:hypothetical protein